MPLLIINNLSHDYDVTGLVLYWTMNDNSILLAALMAAAMMEALVGVDGGIVLDSSSKSDDSPSYEESDGGYVVPISATIESFRVESIESIETRACTSDVDLVSSVDNNRPPLATSR